MPPRKKPAADEAPDEPKLDVRGQLPMPLGGEDYLLRPSFEAVLEIERNLRPAFELAQDAMRGALTLEEMAVCVVAMMKAQGKTLPDNDPQASVYRAASVDQIGRLIYEAGGPRICARLMVVLTGCVNGGYTAEGEAKAGTETTTAPIPAGE